MKLTINKEFFRRHLFAIVIVAGLGLWFGYDGFVTYPRMSAAELYASIEGTPPPTSYPAQKLEAFKDQKIKTQHGLCCILLLAAALIAGHLVLVARLDFAFDEDGFTSRGTRHAWSDIRAVDRSHWTKKGILALTLPETSVTLDAWHHAGVTDFEKALAAHHL